MSLLGAVELGAIHDAGLLSAVGGYQRGRDRCVKLPGSFDADDLVWARSVNEAVETSDGESKPK